MIKLVSKLILYSIFNVLSFNTFDVLFDKGDFYSPYFFLLTIFFLTVLLEWLHYGKTFFTQMPIGNIFFAFIGFYLPLPFIYENYLMKFLAQWDSDYLTLKSLLYTNLGLHSVLIGYNLVKLIKINTFEKLNFVIKENRIYFLIFVSLLSVFLLIITGNYGITQQLTEESNAYITILVNAYQLGYFAIIFLQYYHAEKKLLNILILVIYFLLGLLSGLKENAIVPLIFFGVTYYFRTKTFPKKFAFISVFLIAFTFIIVAKFRTTYLASGRKEIGSLTSLASTYVKSVEESSNAKYKYYNLSSTQAFINRLNYATAFGKSINYCQEEGFGLPYNSSPMHIILSPFYAFIPRFILPFKPLADFGLLISNKVFKLKNVEYSTGISQAGYAYMWKGALGVILLLFFVGIFQGLIYKWFYFTIAPIYIFLFISNIYVGDAIWTYFSSFFRFIFLFALLYYFFGTKLSR